MCQTESNTDCARLSLAQSDTWREKIQTIFWEYKTTARIRSRERGPR